MFSSRTSRWFGLLFLLMLALRIGYKYYRSQQPTATAERLAEANTRREALLKAIEANQQAQRASGAAVVLADSTLAAGDSATTAK